MSPLEYYSPRPPTPPGSLEPRLSKLAVASLVLSLGQACSCPVMYRIGWTLKLAPILTAIAMPAFTFVLSSIALFRILRRMELLRGEGLAISGVIVSFILGLLGALVATGK